jgi:hypothetical protein
MLPVLYWPDKTPAERADYSIDWASALEQTESISVSTWAVPEGLVKVSESVVGKKTILWLRAGVENTQYELRNIVETSNSRILETVVLIVVKTPSV